MEIILKQDMPSLGHTNDIVTVKNGYARNYLIPKGYAIAATVSAKKVLAENIKQRAHKEAKIKGDAESIAKQLEGIKLVIGAKTSSTGKIFGSVNTIQIAEALSEKGLEVDRKNINIKEEHIKEVGNYTAEVKLHRDVKVTIEFEVVAE
jgi:large subunit ribosomal protein L9